jgi:hypothetical protein
VSWEIVLLEPVELWFLGLCESEPETAVLVERALDRLSEVGTGAGSAVGRHAGRNSLPNLKELRPGSRGRSELRLLFVFDPDREAVFLVAGDKAGRWSRWYPEAMALAEQRYTAYRDEKKAERDQQVEEERR